VSNFAHRARASRSAGAPSDAIHSANMSRPSASRSACVNLDLEGTSARRRVGRGRKHGHAEGGVGELRRQASADDEERVGGWSVWSLVQPPSQLQQKMLLCVHQPVPSALSRGRGTHHAPTPQHSKALTKRHCQPGFTMHAWPARSGAVQCTVLQQSARARSARAARSARTAGCCMAGAVAGRMRAGLWFCAWVGPGRAGTHDGTAYQRVFGSGIGRVFAIASVSDVLASVCDVLSMRELDRNISRVETDGWTQTGFTLRREGRGASPERVMARFV
jgi:hypothetical protein